MPERWIREPLGTGMDRMWRLDNVIWEGDTQYQHVVIAKTSQGISLFCDNDRQSTEFSQLVYHEAMMVPAFLLAEQIERVLVIGSSEGVATEMALRAGATRVDHVDIDEECVRACAEHLPYGYDIESLKRAERGEDGVRLHYADGWRFLEHAVAAGEEYDIVVVDLPDEHDDESSQHNRLYGERYLRMCRAALSPGGVVAFQAGCPTVWRNTTLIRSWNRFHDAFESVAYFGSDEHEWAFLFGMDRENDNPVGHMSEALSKCAYRPASIDQQALIGCGVPPYSVRNQT